MRLNGLAPPDERPHVVPTDDIIGADPQVGVITIPAIVIAPVEPPWNRWDFEMEQGRQPCTFDL